MTPPPSRPYGSRTPRCARVDSVFCPAVSLSLLRRHLANLPRFNRSISQRCVQGCTAVGGIKSAEDKLIATIKRNVYDDFRPSKIRPVRSFLFSLGVSAFVTRTGARAALSDTYIFDESTRRDEHVRSSMGSGRWSFFPSVTYVTGIHNPTSGIQRNRHSCVYALFENRCLAFKRRFTGINNAGNYIIFFLFCFLIEEALLRCKKLRFQ